MAKTPETELPVADGYMKLIRSEVAKRGRNRIAAIANIDPTTVHRNVNEEHLTYSTALRLRDAINEASEEDDERPIVVPKPFYPVVNQAHWEMCELAERLLRFPSRFSEELQRLTEIVQQEEADAAIEKAKRSIAHPLRNTDE